MKVIADTNVWYAFGNENSLLEKAEKFNFCPTYVNINELVKSLNIIDKPELSRSAIQSIFHFKDNVIYEPPLIYLAKLHKAFEFDPSKEIIDVLNFSTMLAKGHEVKEDKKTELREFLEEKRAEYIKTSNFFNEEAEKVGERIKNKKEHRKKDTHQLTMGFLDFCVKTATNGNVSLHGFDPNKTELLVRTLDHFFMQVETTRMKIQEGDWFDFTILAYVQPGDKYYTLEKRWINLIKESGCGNYLFNF